MNEKLYALEIPPGFQNNGTTFQARDRWHTGSLVRFFQGKIQPLGGWVKRTLTGATITGVPNAAVSWQLNNGATYLAIGTTTNLYVVTNDNIVYDITPATVAGDGLTHYWQLSAFGAYLVAVFNYSSYTATGNPNFFVWKGVVSSPAEAPYLSSAGPGISYGVVATPERYIVVLRGVDPVTASIIPPVGTPPTVDGLTPSGAVPDPTPTAPSIAPTGSGGTDRRAPVEML